MRLKGNKRALSPGAVTSNLKRTRLNDNALVGSSTHPPATEPQAWPNVRYPRVSDSQLDKPGSLDQGDVVPVWRHTFQLQYLKNPDFTSDLLEKEEVMFSSKLKSLFGHVTEPETIDLCSLEFFKYEGRIVAALPQGQWSETNSDWFCLMPLFTRDLEDNSPEKDLLMASWNIKTAQRASIIGRLRFTALPSGPIWSESMHMQLPFRLEIDFDVSIITPSIFSPFPRARQKGAELNIQDSQKRLAEFLYCNSDSYAPINSPTINIPFFYSSLRSAPTIPKKAEDALQPKALLPELLPFQRRSVAWLLSREGKLITPQGNIVPSDSFLEYSFWEKIQEGNYTFYYNRLSCMFAEAIERDPPAWGAILAEEPGLGKTLETISLILLNPAPPERAPSVKRWDPEAHLHVSTIKGTLIVTPPALASQWIDELAMHAPSLKVLVYEGWSKILSPKPAPKKKKRKSKTKPKKKSRARARHDMDYISSSSSSSDPDPFDSDSDSDLEQTKKKFDWCEYVNQFDVVITTYQTLKSDLYVARAPPDRLRRDNAEYFPDDERPRSPLVKCEWYRVVMDEVQMVGGGKAAEMVSLIPRQSSLAVSGTPARAQISDLIHVLRFLRVDKVIGSVSLWKRLLQSPYANDFVTFIQTYAIRTLKASVRHELTIPQQRRFLVPIELGMVERHVYDHALEGVLLELGLDARGIATSSGWEANGVTLRAAIRNLRGICTHPQVGQLVRPNDKLAKPGTVKTMANVLQTMRDQNWRNIMDDWKAKVVVQTKLARLQQLAQNDQHRYQKARETLAEAEAEVNALLTEINAAIDEHDEHGKELKKEAAAQREALRARKADEAVDPSGKGKGKERAVSEALSIEDSDESDSEDKGIPRTPAGEEYMNKKRALQQRLRECRLVLHNIKFFQGDVFHMLGEAFKQQEEDVYGDAEQIRRELLRVSEADATRAMDQLERVATEEPIDEDALYIETPLLEKGGISSHKLMQEGDHIIDVLNGQTELLLEWRTSLISLLTQKLNNGDSKADGEEYQRDLDNQGEAEAYMQAYTALLADRTQALSSERNLLAAHEVRERRQRSTNAAKRAADWLDEDWELLDEGVEKRPEHEVLLAELSEKRKELLLQLNGRAIKSVIVNLQSILDSGKKISAPEKVLIKDAITTLRRFMHEQNAQLEKLQTDLVAIRKAFNQRVQYFRQLQEISDAVREVDQGRTVEEAIQECTNEWRELQARINTNRARYRYMMYLAKKKEKGEVDEDEEYCILCRCDFLRGFITQCAHIFCEGCLKAWLLKKGGKTCPVCRVPVNPDTIQRFTTDDKEPPPRPVNGEPAPKSKRKIAYNVIDPEIFRGIQSTESFGDYGSKIQTLIRHLLYIQSTEPGAKSIVFSAWADSLYIVQLALRDNGIHCLRIDQNRKGLSAAKKFKSDPNIQVLLLHGERENAGLNITCASRVFLLESVVHHNFEIQAIARIDRMGQTRPTEVYCYYAEDTVERNILDLAARQGLSLYTQDHSEGTLDLTSFTNLNAEKPRVEAEEKKVKNKGDFIYRVDDMLAILFPHMFEDVEYLVEGGMEM
ncbi:hypothetical protein AMATHDRAFT_148016 [Amanita thiersii Skay4041]|uniref:RING-type domain-containing protein n=1 Tax=Amanita thiersii Skay4041 TaxID=703135 RepID=A0A2A9NNM8_9AGAR|nr:hypothetical protein AMATHDRAFT_148016 [Amanita thiersii Skay4041]